MTLDGSLQRRSVTCRYHSMPSPYARYVWTLDTMRGERTTQTVLALPPPRIAARFRTRTCSFLFCLPPSLLSFPPFFIFLLVLSSFAKRWWIVPVGRISRGEGEGTRVAATELEGGWRFCPRLQRACIVSLLHSSPILRSTCVANLRKPWPPSGPVCVFLLFPRSIRTFFVLSSLLLSSLRNQRYPLAVSREHSFVRISRDDYATQCHATSSLTTLRDATSVNVNNNHGEDYARLSFNLFCLYFVSRINFTRGWHRHFVHGNNFPFDRRNISLKNFAFI